MKTVELSFGRINILEKDLAEVIFNGGIEISEKMVDHFHLALASHLKAPYRVLFNKRNNYSYEFAAQRKVSSLPQMKAVACVVYSRAAELSARVVSAVSQTSPLNVNLFSCRDMAINWLGTQRISPMGAVA